MKQAPVSRLSRCGGLLILLFLLGAPPGGQAAPILTSVDVTSTLVVPPDTFVGQQTVGVGAGVEISFGDLSNVSDNMLDGEYVDFEAGNVIEVGIAGGGEDIASGYQSPVFPSFGDEYFYRFDLFWDVSARITDVSIFLTDILADSLVLGGALTFTDTSILLDLTNVGIDASSNFGTVRLALAVTESAVSVPEPVTLSLFTLGLLGLIGRSGINRAS